MMENIKPKRGRPSLNTNDIEDARIITETTEKTYVDTEFVNDVFDTEPSIKLQAEEIHKEQDGTKVNFLDDFKADEVFSQRTEEFKLQDDPFEFTNDKESTVTEDSSNLKDDIKVSVKELEDVSEFLIEMFDTGVSFLCARIADETSSSKFELENVKKVKLSKMLAVILEKRQMASGISIEMLFLVTVCLFYVNPVKAALAIRTKKQTGDYEYTETETENTQRRGPGRPRNARA